MYVALIGLQFIERIYIGPNEDVVMGKLAAWKRTLAPRPGIDLFPCDFI